MVAPSRSIRSRRDTPLAFDLDVTVADDDGDLVKERSLSSSSSAEVNVSVDAGDPGSDPAEYEPYNGTVSLEVLNPTGVGNLQNADSNNQQVITVENGFGSATFEANASGSGTTNISAFKINNENNEYRTDTNDGVGSNDDSDQARINVFTSGNIEGQVVDQDNTVVSDADVTLIQLDPGTTAGDYDRRTTTTGPSGSFTFSDVPADQGQDYRVSAEVNISGEQFEGFNDGQLVNLPGGTTTAGITLNDLELDETQPSQFPDEYTNSNGVVTDDGINTAVQDYINNDLTDTQINSLVASYATGDPVGEA